MGGNEGVDQCYSNRACKRGPDLGDIAKEIDRGFDNLANIGVKGEGGVKDHAKFSSVLSPLSMTILLHPDFYSRQTGVGVGEGRVLASLVPRYIRVSSA